MKAVPLSFGVLIGCLLVVGGVGCGGSQPAAPEESTHLTKVGDLCEEYKKDHKGNNPATLDELQQWAVQNGKGQDADFKSTRDKQPYVLEPMGMGSSKSKGGPVIIREATGKNGKKFVYMNGRASEMGEESLQYMSGKAAGMVKKK